MAMSRIITVRDTRHFKVSWVKGKLGCTLVRSHLHTGRKGEHLLERAEFSQIQEHTGTIQTGLPQSKRIQSEIEQFRNVSPRSSSSETLVRDRAVQKCQSESSSPEMSVRDRAVQNVSPRSSSSEISVRDRAVQKCRSEIEQIKTESFQRGHTN